MGAVTAALDAEPDLLNEPQVGVMDVAYLAIAMSSSAYICIESYGDLQNTRRSAGSSTGARCCNVPRHEGTRTLSPR